MWFVLLLMGVMVMTDRDACYERIRADVFDEIMDVLRHAITSDMCSDLLARASRSDSLYDRVVLSCSANLLAEYGLSSVEWRHARDAFDRYKAEFDTDHGFDVDCSVDPGFDVTE